MQILINNFFPLNSSKHTFSASGYTNRFGTIASLPPRYFGNIAYYLAVAAHGGDACIDGSILFDKRQKEVHRCIIADVRGSVHLTVPITKPHGIQHSTWNDVKISSHGQWWHIHLTTLESAYGRTPFFEFYIDRFIPFLRSETPNKFSSIVELDQAIDSEIRKILLLPPASSSLCNNFSYDSSLLIENNLKNSSLIDSYWQVRCSSLGFIPNLSILDLIFNIGPEAPLYLARLSSNI